MKTAAVPSTVPGNQHGENCADSQDTGGPVTTLKEKLESGDLHTAGKNQAYIWVLYLHHDVLWPCR